MTFLTFNDDANDRYLERTAERLRRMAERTNGLEGADPAKVRQRLQRMDRHARRNLSPSHTAA